ncbi:unnamed protein product [Penicillium viridicatum]
MSEHIDSQETISKISTSQCSSVEDLNATQEKSHPSPLQRLKKQWKEMKKEWGPLMAAKEDLYDETQYFGQDGKKMELFINPGSVIPNVR